MIIPDNLDKGLYGLDIIKITGPILNDWRCKPYVVLTFITKDEFKITYEDYIRERRYIRKIYSYDTIYRS